MGQSNRIWHYWAGKHPGSVGVLIGPSYGKKVPIDPWMPFCLDNDAFTAWRDQKPWDVDAWRRMLARVRMTGLRPMWAAVPDVVADREKTIENWLTYSSEINALGWPTAFCVQDGMTVGDVPISADVVFVGGSDRWKFPNLQMWTDSFPRVHCARVNSPEMFEACERLGCESVDGTGWFRDPSRPDKVPALERFIEGHRLTNNLSRINLCHAGPKNNFWNMNGVVNELVLGISGLGHVPAMKNNKMLTRGRLITNPVRQEWMNRATRLIESQLRSVTQTTAGGTSTAAPAQSWTHSWPLDDSWQWIPELEIKAVKCKKGDEGATITITRL